MVGRSSLGLGQKNLGILDFCLLVCWYYITDFFGIFFDNHSSSVSAYLGNVPLDCYSEQDNLLYCTAAISQWDPNQAVMPPMDPSLLLHRLDESIRLNH